MRLLCLPMMVLPAFAPAQNKDYVVVDIGQLAPLWTVAEKGDRIQLNKALLRSSGEGCVAVGFSIEADGRPSNLTVIRSGFTDRADPKAIANVEQRVLRSFATTRYAASPPNAARRPVYTYAVYSMSAYEAPSTQQEVESRSQVVHKACEIADFPAAVARGDLVNKAR